MSNRHGPDPEETADRVQGLLDELTSVGDPAIVDRVEELIRALMDLYGAGLARVVEMVARSGDTALGDALSSDGLVGALLVLHDLHPREVEERVQGALEQVRPYLGSHAGGVELLGIDDRNVVHLRLEGTCDGCPSSSATVKGAIERAIGEAAPEVAGVHVEGMDAQPHLIPVDSLFAAGTPACPVPPPGAEVLR